MGTIKSMKEVENALPKTKDVNYVRALDTQGNPILISKADLAEVVGGLINNKSMSSYGITVTKGSAILLHETKNEDWNPFSFTVCESVDYCPSVVLFGGRGGLEHTRIEAKTLSGSPSYKIYIKKHNDYKVSIYLQSLSEFFISITKIYNYIGIQNIIPLSIISDFDASDKEEIAIQ